MNERRPGDARRRWTEQDPASVSTAVEQHGAQRDWIVHDADCDCLRDEPRFKQLMARLK